MTYRVSILTDRPLEENPDFIVETHCDGHSEGTYLRYGCICLVGHGPINSKKVENGFEWYFGEDFKDLYHYEFDSPEPSRGLFYIFVFFYLKWGKNIAMIENSDMPWIYSEIPVSKVDTSDKLPGMSAKWDMYYFYPELISWFFNRKDTSQRHDTSLLEHIDEKLRIPAFTIPGYATDKKTTLADIMETCNESVHEFVVYDYDELIEVLAQHGGPDRIAMGKEIERRISPIEIIQARHGHITDQQRLPDAASVDGTDEMLNTKYADHQVIIYGICSMYDFFNDADYLCLEYPIFDPDKLYAYVFVKPEGSCSDDDIFSVRRIEDDMFPEKDGRTVIEISNGRRSWRHFIWCDE